MKISLITVCYNSDKTIKDTLESVLKQSHKDYEYIIVDGKSKDKTLSIIKEYEPKFKGRLKYISEKDKGLYDAMNKGIKISTGDIIGIINSDDILACKDTLKKVIATFKKKQCSGTYSDLEIRDENLEKVVRTFIAKEGSYKLGWFPPHPTLYLKKEVYEKHGNYNQEYRIAADYDFMLRIMKDPNIHLFYINQTLVYMRSGGISTNGLKGYYKSFKESSKVLRDNGIRFALGVNILRIFNIIKQALIPKFK